MDKNEFVRKFERIQKKYGKRQQLAVVRVTFDGGYTDCTGYRIWGKNVTLMGMSGVSTYLNPKGVYFNTVVRLRKVKAVRKATVL